jgi:hypothetical protein
MKFGHTIRVLLLGGGVAGHIARGIVGAGLLILALLYSSNLGWWVAIPAIGALLCFRGCPMCWTAGLVESVLDRRSGGTACTDGSCTNPKPTSKP